MYTAVYMFIIFDPPPAEPANQVSICSSQHVRHLHTSTETIHSSACALSVLLFNSFEQTQALFKDSQAILRSKILATLAARAAKDSLQSLPGLSNNSQHRRKLPQQGFGLLQHLQDIPGVSTGYVYDLQWTYMAIHTHMHIETEI